MDTYFEEIVDSLTINDIKVLGYLNDQDADMKFKSVKREVLRNEINLTLAEFRRVVCRLEITKLIDIVTDQKEHRIYITNLGKIALFKSLSEEVI